METGDGPAIGSSDAAKAARACCLVNRALIPLRLVVLFAEEEDLEETGEEVKENIREVVPVATKRPSRAYARRHPPRGHQTHRGGVARTKGPLPLPAMDIIEWTPVPVDDDDYRYVGDCPSVEV